LVSDAINPVSIETGFLFWTIFVKNIKTSGYDGSGSKEIRFYLNFEFIFLSKINQFKNDCY
ncbi:hypothetical protein ACSV4D_18015, partial [Flavobacterium sp. ARAG 55.4]|uniref:hypothetical protein n=1 Tax=Flavobacterium sp. ARAG 55.4 TaxID=3451357 RepID=UPI003F47453E